MVSPAVLAGQSLPRLVTPRAPALHRAATVLAAPSLLQGLEFARSAVSPSANYLARASPPPFATAAALLEPSWLRANLRQKGAQGRITL